MTPTRMSRRSTAEKGSRVHCEPGEPGGDGGVTAGKYVEAWGAMSRYRSRTIHCLYTASQAHVRSPPYPPTMNDPTPPVDWKEGSRAQFTACGNGREESRVCRGALSDHMIP